jgi:phosphoheptose isomerase
VHYPGVDQPTICQRPRLQRNNSLCGESFSTVNGVAYFERRGTVSDKAEVNLQFKQSQVDDVLKSMLVLDLGRGQIGAVSYNSSAPPSARLAEIPFAIEAGTDDIQKGGLAGVLRQLQGERVAVTTSTRSATGAILTVEERRSQIAADKPAFTTYALVIATAAGEFVSFDLVDVRSVRLIDEGARQDVTDFANASASARRRDAKTIVITSDGIGQREMVVSYTIAAPIWKTTYRVVLDSTGKPFFQGWAIVDNVGDEDWLNVSLSLFSGTPISFIPTSATTALSLSSGNSHS